MKHVRTPDLKTSDKSLGVRPPVLGLCRAFQRKRKVGRKEPGSTLPALHSCAVCSALSLGKSVTSRSPMLLPHCPSAHDMALHCLRINRLELHMANISVRAGAGGGCGAPAGLTRCHGQ